jgi:putative hydrolase of the HAD superfamily
MSSSKFDTIILDLGGVLIDVDYQRTAKEFQALGCGNFDQLYSKAKQSKLFDSFETGLISPPEFCQQVRGLVSDDLTDVQIISAWNSMLGSIPQERIELLKELKERYQLLLLSNTNAIHVPAFEHIIAKENGIHDFKGLFDGAYYSCEIGLRKPHSEAFDFVLEQHGANKARTLFIDDSIQHVEGARESGVHAEHLDLAYTDIISLTYKLDL